jgi:hypothetical protein
MKKIKLRYKTNKLKDKIHKLEKSESKNKLKISKLKYKISKLEYELYKLNLSENTYNPFSSYRFESRFSETLYLESKMLEMKYRELRMLELEKGWFGRFFEKNIWKVIILIKNKIIWIISKQKKK